MENADISHSELLKSLRQSLDDAKNLQDPVLAYLIGIAVLEVEERIAKRPRMLKLIDDYMRDCA